MTAKSLIERIKTPKSCNFFEVTLRVSGLVFNGVLTRNGQVKATNILIWFC